MDWLTFFSELTKAISWPFATVVIVILLRQPISSLLLRLKEIYHKDSGAHFWQEVQQLKNEAEIALPKPDDSVPEESDFAQRITEISNNSPVAAVIDAWYQVERASNEMFKSRGLPSTRSQQKRMNLLLTELPPNLFKLAMELRSLRNLALHLDPDDISQVVAVDYGKIAEQLIDYMSKKTGEV